MYGDLAGDIGFYCVGWCGAVLSCGFEIEVCGIGEEVEAGHLCAVAVEEVFGHPFGMGADVIEDLIVDDEFGDVCDACLGEVTYPEVGEVVDGDIHLLEEDGVCESGVT